MTTSHATETISKIKNAAKSMIDKIDNILEITVKDRQKVIRALQCFNPKNLSTKLKLLNICPRVYCNVGCYPNEENSEHRSCGRME